MSAGRPISIYPGVGDSGPRRRRGRPFVAAGAALAALVLGLALGDAYGDRPRRAPVVSVDRAVVVVTVTETVATVTRTIVVPAVTP